MESSELKTIWVLIGLPASGKSMWAKEQLMRYPGKYKRVNKDLLRLMLDNDKFDFENEKFVLKMRDTVVESALRRGYDVIVDDTNFPVGGKHFKRMCEIAQKVGNVRVIEKYFDISLKDALARNMKPDRIFVPEDVIKNMYNKYVKGGISICNDLYFTQNLKKKFENGLPYCIIFDIDGTLSHMNNMRGPYDWNEVSVDSVDENIQFINNIIHRYSESYINIDIIIFTGRDGIAKEKTEEWLEYNSIYYDKLYIKGINDNRKDTIVKEEFYNNYIKDKYNVIAIFDDRSQIVDLWRSLGLTCLQVAYGDF